jgi:hypothetical protein
MGKPIQMPAWWSPQQREAWRLVYRDGDGWHELDDRRFAKGALAKRAAMCEAETLDETDPRRRLLLSTWRQRLTADPETGAEIAEEIT